MTTIQGLRQRIENDWEGTDALPMALYVYDSLVENHERFVDTPIDFWKFTHAKQYKANEEKLSEFINYLIDPKINLVRLRYEYFDAMGIHPLTAEDVLEAQTTGGLVHPITGEIIESYEDDVVVTFILNPTINYDE